MSDIGAMVEELVAAGTPPAVAARVVAEAFSAGVLSAPTRRQSYDETDEKRRERDRIYRANKRAEERKSSDNRTTSAESYDNTDTALLLKSNNSKEEKKERARKHPCPPTFEPTERHFAWAEKENIPRSAVLSKAEDMKLWAQSTGEQKKDWGATLEVWMRRDAANMRAKPVKGAPSGVPIKAGDKTWNLWKAHYRDTGNSLAAIMDAQAQRGGSITVPSEYPPGYEHRNDDAPPVRPTAEVA